MDLTQFKNKILGLLQKGGATKKDLSIINSLLTQRIKQIEISSIALISAFILSSKDPQTKLIDKKKLDENLDKVEKIFTKAINNIENNQAPFSNEERKALVEVFNSIGLDGDKTADRFITNFDQLLGEKIISNASELRLKLNSSNQYKNTQNITQNMTNEKKEENLLKR